MERAFYACVAAGGNGRDDVAATSGLACALTRFGQLPLSDLDHRRVAHELIQVTPCVVAARWIEVALATDQGGLEAVAAAATSPTWATAEGEVAHSPREECYVLGSRTSWSVADQPPPGVAPEAITHLERAGVGQVDSFPLISEGVVHGVLDVFRDGPHPVPDLDRQLLNALETLATVAGTTLGNLDAFQRETHASEHLQDLLDRSAS